MKVSVSVILKWYRVDFGVNDEEVYHYRLYEIVIHTERYTDTYTHRNRHKLIHSYT